MTIWSMNYHGYTISGDAAKENCQYQSPDWPDDPRIVKAPSLDTAKRLINTEIRRRDQTPNGNHVYLKKDRQEVNLNWVTPWVIVDAQGKDLVQPWFNSQAEAREFAYSREWVLLEHFNY